MLKPHARFAPAVVLLAVLALSLAGCSLFAPPGGGDPPGDDGSYKDRITCENVLHNLARSYERMESEEYIDCLADTFTFWLNEDDVIADPELPWYWDLAMESAIAHNMLDEGTAILSIQLTLTQFGDEEEIPAEDPADPSSWLYVETVDLWVNLPDDFRYRADSAARFKFSVDPNEVGPNGETLWEIAKWEDIGIEGRPTIGDDPAEEISLGRLKAAFR